MITRPDPRLDLIVIKGSLTVADAAWPEHAAGHGARSYVCTVLPGLSVEGAMSGAILGAAALAFGAWLFLEIANRM